MKLTLLLDLDNTLLDNSMETFVPAYLGALAQRMAVTIDPSFMMKTLLAATNQMMQNNQPDLSLMQVFDAAFYPALGLDKTLVQQTIESFYAQDFPKLKTITRPRPAAVELVKEALRRGYQVGIATNPLFPRTAILQRLEWACLPPAEYPFVLIPDYASFHFSKPNPAFFAEYLAQIGCPEGAVVMVGDEADLDITAARQFGLPAFWIHSDGDKAWPGPDTEPAHGSLADVLGWIDSVSSEQLQINSKTPSGFVYALNGTPAALLTLSAGMSVDQWTHRLARAEWSPVEIICHLRDVEAEVNLPRLRTVLQVQNPFLPSQDTDAWAESRHYLEQDGQQALWDFVRFRKETLDLLCGLQKEDWDRLTRHAIFGPTRFHELVGMIVEHDRIHIQQFIHSKSPRNLSEN